MAALSRFIARRRRPLSILSDNATNFVAWSMVFSNLNSELPQHGIDFKFIPTNASMALPKLL